MPHLDLPQHRLHYRIDGYEGRPWLTLCNSLGTDLHMWDPNIDALRAQFRVLRYDRRGHGGSTAPPGPYSAADLGRDVLALFDALHIERSHFCGLSIGGLTGQWLGLHAADRLDRLILCSTAAKIGTAAIWQERIAQVQAQGLSSLVDGTVQRWFEPSFVAAHPALTARIAAAFLSTSPQAYIGCCHALAETDFRERLAQLAVPTLALAGSDDPVTPPADLRFIAERVVHGEFAQLPGRHIFNWHDPAAFNVAALAFLNA
ncbi:3-oxoadipate enol-lactonase [Lysobacter sp. CA199]|uniref:3-oxoadipate enol-lactonase n=1 Tax=Lysobacter sp. CA199 TaxID=3455608 RepID=UPI003F8D1678